MFVGELLVTSITHLNILHKAML